MESCEVGGENIPRAHTSSRPCVRMTNTQIDEDFVWKNPFTLTLGKNHIHSSTIKCICHIYFFYSGANSMRKIEFFV